MVGGSCANRSRESPNGALTFASNHGLGMAIAQSVWRTGRSAASIFRRTIVARLASHRARHGAG